MIKFIHHFLLLLIWMANFCDGMCEEVDHFCKCKFMIPFISSVVLVVKPCPFADILFLVDGWHSGRVWWVVVTAEVDVVLLTTTSHL